VNAEQASKRVMRKPTRLDNGEGRRRGGHVSSLSAGGTSDRNPRFRRGNGDGMSRRKANATREAPAVAARDRQRDAREGQARPPGVTERLVVAMKPGNAGRAKEPWFWNAVGRNKGRAIGMCLATSIRPNVPDAARLPGEGVLPDAVCPTVTPVREPDAGNPPVRFDERELETEHG